MLRKAKVDQFQQGSVAIVLVQKVLQLNIPGKRAAQWESVFSWLPELQYAKVERDLRKCPEISKRKHLGGNDEVVQAETFRTNLRLCWK